MTTTTTAAPAADEGRNAAARGTERTLYQIGGDMLALEQLLAEVGGDVTDEDAERAIDEWLAETNEALPNKLDRYAMLMREIQARAETRAAEAARLAERARLDGQNVKRMKERVKAFFLEHGLKAIDTPHFRLTLARNGGKEPLVWSINSYADLPEEYRTEETVYKPLEQAVRDAIKGLTPAQIDAYREWVVKVAEALEAGTEPPERPEEAMGVPALAAMVRIGERGYNLQIK